VLRRLWFAPFADWLRWFTKHAGRYALPDLQRYVVVERTGMRLLIGDAQFWKQIQNDVRLDFELPSQLVDANLTHN
jgi:hypothetical protein